MWVFAFQGLDLTNATYLGAIRQVPDGGGAPLVSLFTEGTLDVEGFCFLVITSEQVDFGGDIGLLTVPVTYVQLRISKATADAFTYPIEKDGEDLVLFWDMHILPLGADEYRALEGTLTVHLGATGSS